MKHLTASRLFSIRKNGAYAINEIKTENDYGFSESSSRRNSLRPLTPTRGKIFLEGQNIAASRSRSTTPNKKSSKELTPSARKHDIEQRFSVSKMGSLYMNQERTRFTDLNDRQTGAIYKSYNKDIDNLLLEKTILRDRSKEHSKNIDAFRAAQDARVCYD